MIKNFRCVNISSRDPKARGFDIDPPRTADPDGNGLGFSKGL